MSDLERMIIVISIAMGVLFVGLLVGLTLLLLFLRLAPKAVQQRVAFAMTRWNELMFQFLGRASYAFAVVIVVTIGLPSSVQLLCFSCLTDGGARACWALFALEPAVVGRYSRNE